MIKIRVQGTPNDQKWFNNFLNSCTLFNIVSNSEILKNKDTKKYFRVFYDIEIVEKRRRGTI